MDYTPKTINIFSANQALKKQIYSQYIKEVKYIQNQGEKNKQSSFQLCVAATQENFLSTYLMQNLFLLLLMNVFLFQPLHSLLSINFDIVVLLVKTKITSTLFAPDLKKASLMERIIAVVVSQF